MNPTDNLKLEAQKENFAQKKVNKISSNVPVICMLCHNCNSNETKKHYAGYKCLKCKSVFWA